MVDHSPTIQEAHSRSLQFQSLMRPFLPCVRINGTCSLIPVRSAWHQIHPRIWYEHKIYSTSATKYNTKRLQTPLTNSNWHFPQIIKTSWYFALWFCKAIARVKTPLVEPHIHEYFSYRTRYVKIFLLCWQLWNGEHSTDFRLPSLRST